MVNIPKTEEHIIPGHVVRQDWYRYLKDLSFSLRPSNSGNPGGPNNNRTQFWVGTDDGYPAPPSIFRIRERVFIGNYASATGGFGVQASPVWLNAADGPNYVLRDAHLAVSNEGGWIAVGGAAATSQSNAAVVNSAIGGAFFAVGDTNNGVAWGLYSESIRQSSGSFAAGVEVDVRNCQADVVPNSYNLGTGAYALWIGCGPGDDTGANGYGPAPTNPSAAAIAVLRNNDGANTYSFNRGLIFRDDAITMVGGVGTAIEMAAGHQIRWDSPDGTASFRIRSDLGDSDMDWTQYAAGSVLAFARNSSAESVFQMTGVASAVNFVTLTNSATGIQPTLTATGTDTDVSLGLAVKGAGVVRSGASVLAKAGTAIPAGGTAGSGFMFSTTANFGVFFGSGAPGLSAAKGSLYLRSDGTGTTDRAYINTNGSTTWTAIVTVA